MSKFFVLFLLLLVCVGSVGVVPVFAAESLLSSNPTSNYFSGENTSGGGGRTANGTGQGISITGNGQYLSRAKFYVTNLTAVPTGFWAVDIHVGASGAPQILESSNNLVNLSSLGWTCGARPEYQVDWDDFVEIEFTFDADFVLENGVTYLLCFVAYGTLNSNYVVAYADGSATSTWSDSGSNWAQGTRPYLYYVYTDDGATPSPSPSPTVSSTPYVSSDIEVLIADLMNYIVYLLVLLVPALLLWWKAGKWGFFVGLICGAVLSYLFLGFAQNFWGLVLIGIVICIAVVANTRGGG